MRYLLDTNVVSELIRRESEPRVIRWVDSIDPKDVFLSVFSIGEICKGIAKLPPSPRKEVLYIWLTTDLLERFRGNIFTLDVDSALVWGELIGRLERVGRPLPAIDSFIAALALQHDCQLVTRNEADFKDTGIITINPWMM